MQACFIYALMFSLFILTLHQVSLQSALKVIASNKCTNVDSLILTNDTVCFVMQREKTLPFSLNAPKQTTG